MGNDLGMKLLAYFIMLREHLAGDLCVARFICPDKAELIAADEGDQPIEQQKSRDNAENKELVRRLGSKPLPLMTEPGNRGALLPCAGRGGLLKIAH